VLAHSGGRFASGAALLAAGAALGLLVLCVVRRRNILAPVRRQPRLFAVLGCLEAANLVLYASALHLGPLPVIVGLHLTSPILMVVWTCLRRQRPFSLMLAAESALIVGAVALIAAGAGERHSAASVLGGAVLALGSAVAVAALITMVARHASSETPEVGAALQMSVAAILTLPLIAVDPPSGPRLWHLGAAGAVLLAPGFALYWRALRGLTAQAASTIGLNEAVAASVVGALAYGSRFGLISLVAGLLVVLAVMIELGRSGAIMGGQPSTSY
jgi:drug/metabolite transporter (DMT)-like permease